MEEGFFDFDTSVPPSRGDKMDNDLMEAQEDGNIDELNDETFGAVDLDEDWEEHHEKLAEEIELHQDEFFKKDRIHNGHPAEQKFSDRQEDLEQSLRQLVVDDDDDVVDPAIMNASRYQPIPGKSANVNLDDLFGPSSPPGFLNTEHLVSPGKANIWGSPTREEVVSRVMRDGGSINNLLKMLQQPKHMAGGPSQDPSILLAGQPLPVPGKVHSAEELEKALLKGNGVSGGKPIMAEELERQLAGGQSAPVPIPGQLHHHPMQQHSGSPQLPPHMMQGRHSGSDLGMGSPQQNAFHHPGGVNIPGARPRHAGQRDVCFSSPSPYPEGYINTPGSAYYSPSPGSAHYSPSPQPPASSANTPIAKFFQKVAENNPQSIASTPVSSGSRKPRMSILKQLQQSWSPKPPSSFSSYNVESRCNSPDMYSLANSCNISSMMTSPLPCMRGGSTTPTLPYSVSTSSAPASLCLRTDPYLTNTKSVSRTSPLMFNLSMDGSQRYAPCSTPPVSYPSPTPSPPLSMFPRKPSPLLQNLSVTHALLAAKLQLAKSLLPKLMGPGGMSGGSPGPASQSQGLPSFLANTPVRQHRGSMPMGMSDPTGMVRPRTTGPFPPHLKQNLFNQNRMPQPPPGQHNWEGGYGQRNGGHPQRDGPYPPDMHGSPHQRGGYPRDYRDREWGDGRGDGRPRGRGWGHHQGHRHYQWQHQQRDYDPERGNGDRDEYAQLMTQKEKDWIIKIQLMQLHTDNPYLDDYYYTTWNMKRLAEERNRKRLEGERSTERDQKELQLVIPQLAKLDSKAYKPVQFEGSLGRLTASSVHNPRQIIEVAINTSTDVDEPKQGRRFKQLLIYIEEHYNLLLDIDDIEKKALALPEEMRPTLYLQRQNMIADLLKSFHCEEEDDLLERIASIPKGVRLMARLMPLLNRNQARALTASILSHMHFFMKKEYQQETCEVLYEAIRPWMSRAKLEDLVQWADSIQMSAHSDNCSITAMLQAKFASSIIWGLIHQGEEVYQNTSPVDMEVEHQNAWVKFVQWLGEMVSSSAGLNLAKPSRYSPSYCAHLERLLDKKTWLSIEDRIKEFGSCKEAQS